MRRYTLASYATSSLLDPHLKVEPLARSLRLAVNLCVVQNAHIRVTFGCNLNLNGKSCQGDICRSGPKQTLSQDDADGSICPSDLLTF